MKQVFIAFDQLLNATLGGYADETLSARAYRQAVKGRPQIQNIINKLFFWQEDHCHQAWLSEVQRKQLPKDYRKSLENQ